MDSKTFHENVGKYLCNISEDQLNKMPSDDVQRLAVLLTELNTVGGLLQNLSYESKNELRALQKKYRFKLKVEVETPFLDWYLQMMEAVYGTYNSPLNTERLTSHFKERVNQIKVNYYSQLMLADEVKSTEQGPSSDEKIKEQVMSNNITLMEVAGNWAFQMMIWFGDYTDDLILYTFYHEIALQWLRCRAEKEVDSIFHANLNKLIRKGCQGYPGGRFVRFLALENRMVGRFLRRIISQVKDKADGTLPDDVLVFYLSKLADIQNNEIVSDKNIQNINGSKELNLQIQDLARAGQLKHGYIHSAVTHLTRYSRIRPETENKDTALAKSYLILANLVVSTGVFQQETCSSDVGVKCINMLYRCSFEKIEYNVCVTVKCNRAYISTCHKIWSKNRSHN